MKRTLVNFFAMLVIGIGGFILTTPQPVFANHGHCDTDYCEGEGFSCCCEGCSATQFGCDCGS